MLNQEGIEILAGYLVANAKRYNQATFGSKEECGTTCCMAGFARMDKIGKKAYNLEVKNTYFKDTDEEEFDRDWDMYQLFADQCEVDGEGLLGIKSDSQDTPQIFEVTAAWPEDLFEEWTDADKPKQKVLVALKALQRLKKDGSIDPNPKKVRNPLPSFIAQVS